MFSVVSLSSRLDPLGWPAASVRRLATSVWPCATRLTAAECRGPGGSLHESCCLTRLTLSGSHMPMTTCHPVTESNTSCQCCGQRRRSASTVSSRPWGNCVCPGCMSSEAGRLSVDDDWLGDADANGRLPRHAPPRLLGDGFLQACHLARTSPHCRVTSDLGFRV